MKKIVFLAGTLLAVFMFAACGSSKQSAITPGDTTKGTTRSPYGLKMELTECQMLAEESPATRAWGDAVNHRLAQAKAYAEGQARAAFARAIATIVKTATNESDLQWEKFAATADEGNTVTDGGNKADGFTMNIANEVVSNAVVIKTEQFMQPNRMYHVFVCLEYQGDASAMSQSIVNKVKQLVPDEDRLKMEYQFQQFEKKVNEELKNRGDK